MSHKAVKEGDVVLVRCPKVVRVTGETEVPISLYLFLSLSHTHTHLCIHSQYLSLRVFHPGAVLVNGREIPPKYYAVARQSVSSTSTESS